MPTAFAESARSSPLLGREPEVRLEANAAPFARFADAQRVRVDRAAYELEAEVTEPDAKQRRVVESFPPITDARPARALMRLSGDVSWQRPRRLRSRRILRTDASVRRVWLSDR
jgi:hypothetical protein